MCYHVRAAGRGVLLPDADGYTTEPAKRKMQVLSLLKKKNTLSLILLLNSLLLTRI